MVEPENTTSLSFQGVMGERHGTCGAVMQGAALDMKGKQNHQIYWARWHLFKQSIYEHHNLAGQS